MKKYLLLFIAFTFIAFTFYGCKKETSYPVPPHSGFIQFQLDGQQYQYYALNNSTAYGTVSFSNSVGKHSIQVYFYATDINSAYQSVSLEQTSADSIQVKNYVYSAYSNTEFPQFTQQLVNLFRYTLTSKSTGNIQITRLDTVPGGLVQGTFNFTDLEAINQYNTVESYPHSITNGTFSVTIGQ